MSKHSVIIKMTNTLVYSVLEICVMLKIWILVFYQQKCIIHNFSYPKFHGMLSWTHCLPISLYKFLVHHTTYLSMFAASKNKKSGARISSRKGRRSAAC